MRIAAAAVTAVASLAAAGAAHAAALSVDKRCYVSEGTERQPIAVNGTGFTPGGAVTLSVGGQTGQLPVTPQGTISTSFSAPPITANQQKFTISATEGANSARRTFYVTRARADFFPSTGSPRSLRVRFYVIGLGAALAAGGQPSNAVVYGHWRRPGGGFAGVRRMGRLSGPCGTLVTARQRALPFGSSAGSWEMRFNTSPSNSARGFARKPYVSVGLRVRVF